MEMPGGVARVGRASGDRAGLRRLTRFLRRTARPLRRKTLWWDRRGMTVGKFALRSDQSALSIGSSVRHRLGALAQQHRRPLCFMMVGGLGLVTDIVLFTLAAMQGVHPLVAGFLALVAATVLTWRLNRAFTFDRSGRHQG